MKQLVKLKDIATHSKGAQINGDELIDGAEFDYLNGGINPSGKWNEANCAANTITIIMIKVVATVKIRVFIKYLPRDTVVNALI